MLDINILIYLIKTYARVYAIPPRTSETRACSPLVLGPYSKPSTENILLGLMDKLELVQRTFLTLRQFSIICRPIDFQMC